MKRFGWLLIVSVILAALPARANITAFKHIVVIVQENRTPDNLFNAMCQPHGGPAQCDNQPYDIKTDNWANNNGQGPINPVPVDLAIPWDIRHHHSDWVAMCDQQGSVCQMDGAVGEHCKDNGTGGCGTNNGFPEFTYVQRYYGGMDVLGPYINMAMNYGWANQMYQTNQGPSFPAHQFIYGATSAPNVTSSENDDANGIYAAENIGVTDPNGCIAAPTAQVNLIVKGQ